MVSHTRWVHWVTKYYIHLVVTHFLLINLLKSVSAKLKSIFFKIIDNNSNKRTSGRKLVVEIGAKFKALLFFLLYFSRNRFLICRMGSTVFNSGGAYGTTQFSKLSYYHKINFQKKFLIYFLIHFLISFWNIIW